MYTVARIYFQLRPNETRYYAVLHYDVGKVIECIKVKSVKNGISEFKRAV